MNQKTITIKYTSYKSGHDPKDMLETVGEMIEKEIDEGHLNDGFSLITWKTTKESDHD